MSTASRVTVRVIPPTIAHAFAGPLALKRKRLTAGYARVSTDEVEQQSSQEAQIEYYTEYIQSNPEWEFVEVYADEGRSGTSTKRRKDFNRMIQDALDGKIDLIVTKSISRFARNTVDTLLTVRKLREKGVEVYFEKENIYTLDAKGELLLTILSSLAQEESRSISENVTWGQRKRMADGKVSIAYKSFLGYEKGSDGKPQIVESEARIVRMIYSLFLQGKAYNELARYLTDQNIPTPRGKKMWRVSTVESILKNEKYRGDAILQKTFTVDFLTKRSKVNQGELPQYHVEKSHPAIIEPQVHDLVQAEIERRAAEGAVKSGLGVFARRVICGECGGQFGPKIWHSRDQYRRVVFQCNKKYGAAGKRCATPHVTEAMLKTAFVEALNRLIGDRSAVIEDIKLILPVLANTAELEDEQVTLVRKRDELRTLLTRCVEENAFITQDQRVYQTRYEELSTRHEAVQSQLEVVTEKLRRLALKRDTLQWFMEELAQREGLITTFDEASWHTLADSVTITVDFVAIFKFKSGMEIGIKLRKK